MKFSFTYNRQLGNFGAQYQKIVKQVTGGFQQFTGKIPNIFDIFILFSNSREIMLS